MGLGEQWTRESLPEGTINPQHTPCREGASPPCPAVFYHPGPRACCLILFPSGSFHCSCPVPASPVNGHWEWGVDWWGGQLSSEN